MRREARAPRHALYRLRSLLARATHDARRATMYLRRIAGMPDYQLYLAHMQERHAGETPLTERDYFTTYLESRYADGPNRCC